MSQPLMEVEISDFDDTRHISRFMKNITHWKFEVSWTSGARARPAQSFEDGVKIGAAATGEYILT